MVDFNNKTFDAIVVGAGPAGCVLASRLSERSDREILLVEAGPDVVAPGAEHPDVLDPFAPVASNNPAFHWPNLVAATGAHANSESPGVFVPYVQGYGVGGGSNINGMAVDRGQPDDYDEWQELGAKGWTWADVLPYFKRLEHDLDFSDAKASRMHGNCGPMPVRRLPRSQWPPFAAAIGVAFERNGFDYIEDYTADFGEGFSAAPTNSLADRRVSAAMAYLTREVRERPNLTILPNTRAERISFEGRRAVGVRVKAGGSATVARGDQVIISCGAIQSPVLLMQSGIGLGEHLATHGITVLQDLPGVGMNLQNHPCLILATYLSSDATQSSDNHSFLQNWLRFSSNHPRCPHSDMHLMVFNKCEWHKLGQRVGAVALSVLKPYSKGRVALSSVDPAEPKVDFNLLGDPRDGERLMHGLRFVLQVLTDLGVAKTRRDIFIPDDQLVASLSKRNSWNRLRAGLIAWVLDRALLRHTLLANARVDTQTLLGEPEALRDFVWLRTQVQYHVCGTCRMGQADDPGAVVDHEGRVHRVEGLRVVDASIFPTIPRAYTHFVVIMVAEKIADAIKDLWHQ